MICLSLVTVAGKSIQKPLTVRLSQVRMATSCSDLLEATRGMSDCKRETSSKITTNFRNLFDLLLFFFFTALDIWEWDISGFLTNKQMISLGL